MPKRLHLPAALLVAGLFVTAVHDYAYRRVDNGEGDYELWGAVTHAGTDMIITTLALVAIALLWPGERQ